ncbi:MAG: Uma2 family endonuclease [Leptolyngbyaceae cyanobacterium RU_5_1]|nr:Uma2 family endonuclease [Leptolyngbyaceae cyanobacterium RU_5_1]
MTTATPVSVPIKSIELNPGSMVTIHDLSWEQFEAILEELGEQRSTRIAYNNGTLEIMSPLPAHERPNRIIGYIVTTLLDAEERDWEDFGSTTFRRKKKMAGLEPDTCFYIQNAQRVRDCMMNMDLDVYPPPDLAIEADVTSKTTLEAYRNIGVPEVWVYDNRQLKINLLQAGQYVESINSPIFPNLPISEMIPELVEEALREGSSQVLRNLRKQMSQDQE